MQGRRIKKKNLRWRILSNIAAILAFSMVISSLVGYWYFERVVREQRISDERRRLQQVSDQLEFMTEDIRQFAKSILIDEELQRLLGEEASGSEYLKQRRSRKVATRLVFYGSLRGYIRDTIIKMEDGTHYGSSYSTIDTAYIKEKLQQEEIAKYDGKGEYSFSDPYNTGGKNGSALICFQMQMFDKYHFGQRKGTLYMECGMDYFLGPVHTYAGADNYVCVLGNNGSLLYGQDPDGELSRCLETRENPEEGIYRIGNGYLICEEIGGAGWKLCTLVTSEYLWQRSSFVLLFFLCSFLFSVSLILIFISSRMERVIRPITELSAQMEKIEYGKLESIETVHTGDEIETLYHSFRHMLEQLQKGEEERLKYEEQKHKMEYDITMSQIHPHYLYNVLNTVVYLAAAGKNKDVVEIVHALIDTLHSTLAVGEESVETTLGKELMLTQSYLSIQKYRYPDVFTVIIQCSEALKQCKVPRIVIQPLVENAILHGILPAERPGTVWIRVWEEAEELRVLVEDNGVGIAEEYMERFQNGEEVLSKRGGRKHIGVSNVRDRIHYLYGETYGMEIKKREGGGTGILLKLPLVEAEEKEEKTEEED